MEFHELAHRRDSNRQHQATAFGWASLLNGFRNKDTEPLKYESLLPYSESNNDVKSKPRVLTNQTAQILAHLLDTDQIPGRVKHFVVHIEEVQRWQINRRK